MQDVLVSGKETFRVEVPYKLIETGRKGEEKPLLIYLHGFKDNIKKFEKRTEKLTDLKAYHLFLQGPYPIYERSRDKEVSDWGRAWYLYDGNDDHFVKSLEISSQFIHQVLDRLLKLIQVNRIGVIGYSMGGYLAGYFALTRWRHVNDLIVIGARIKTEVLQGAYENLKHLQILAMHGTEDESVKPEPQQEEIEKLQKQGVSATFKAIRSGHKLTSPFIDEAKNWLILKGYKSINDS